jgi:uncharacterized protein (DUF58 family)
MDHVSRRLNVRREFVERAFPGDRVTVRLLVKNDSWLPIPWLEIYESLPPAISAVPNRRDVVSLGPQEERAFEQALDCRRRGYYPVGPLRLEMGDLLGAHAPPQRTLPADHITVYPRVLPLDALGLPTEAPLVELETRVPLFEDPTRLMGVRDYQHGDSPRRIHWPATASLGRLVVKLYQYAVARETLICLDANRDHYGQRQVYTATELAIVAAASLANHIVTREKLPVGLVMQGGDPLAEDVVDFRLPPRSERAHLIGVLEALARVEAVSGPSFVQLLRRESTLLSWGGTLVAVTGKESDALYDTLAYLRRRGLAVVLMLVQPGLDGEAVDRDAEALGIPVHRIWQEMDLEVIA